MHEHPFPPVMDSSSRILILGSFPSVASRAEGFFYGHPRNRFWPLLADIFNADLPQSVSEKERLLLGHHLALWDVIATCRIEGSADSSIRDAVPVEIRRVLDVAPVERILCNGALAGKLYRQYLQPVTGMEAQVLPSTSPANAAWSMPRLISACRPCLLTQKA